MPNEPRSAAPTFLTWAALLAALVAAAGSIWLSLGMNLLACPLCFYQRTFALGAAAVLILGLLFGAGHRPLVGLLAVPLAAGGAAVAGFHVSLERSGILECPEGVFGMGTAPNQSLAAFAVLLLVLLADVVMNRQALCCGWSAVLTAVLLGGACAYGCIASAPKLPDPPKDRYDPEKKINTCRRPFKGTE